MSSFRQLAKDAKNRIKSGYWENSLIEFDNGLKSAKQNGVSESRVRKYYVEKVKNDLRGTADEDEFYFKVKKILDEVGEVSDILGRLADKEVLNNLPYEQRQRYFLDLSSKYRQALDRYKKEKEIFG